MSALCKLSLSKLALEKDLNVFERRHAYSIGASQLESSVFIVEIGAEFRVPAVMTAHDILSILRIVKLFIRARLQSSGTIPDNVFKLVRPNLSGYYACTKTQLELPRNEELDLRCIVLTSRRLRPIRKFSVNDWAKEL